MSGRNLTYGKGRTGGGVVFFLFLLGVVLTLGLYFVKTRAQTAKSEARTLQRTLDAEQLVVSTLKAELAHLGSWPVISLVSLLHPLSRLKRLMS